MENFISIVIPSQEISESAVLSILHNIAETPLMEDTALLEVGLTEDNSTLLQAQISKDLTNEEADIMVKMLSEKIFDAGYDCFDIYVSGDGEEE